MGRIKHHKYEIDATGKAPGRVATEAATRLIGKHMISYEFHLDKGDKVIILNADKAVFTGKKIDQKIYRHHSMHPGGLKEVPVKKVAKEDPEEVIRHAVMRMLPKNKLRADRIRRLQFK
jgi:large subunit ribosomal protein L13